MKQIDIIKTYAQKRCLVVDELPDARAMLKRILVDFGAQDTDTAGNVVDAIELCQRRQYDIVIAEYNLGSGKNGQQLLEELRFHNYLRNSALFIMITSENASHEVLHALEYEPDDFLQKPINRESLRPRLDQALLKNEYLRDVKEALDKQKIGRAIAAAVALLEKPNRFQIDARKILAELYLKNKQPDEAESTYAQLDPEKMPLWANLGLANVEYQRKQFDAAEKRLNAIIREHPNCVDAHDLLARVFEATHRPAQSQNALMNAVKVSPRSAPRQRELGRVSLDIGDQNASVHAFRSAIRHSKNSCHEAADDYVNLAEGLVRLAKKGKGSPNKSLINEAKEHLASASKKYGKHPIIQMRGKLIEADMCLATNNQASADESLKAAIELHANMQYSVIGNSSIQLCIECAKSFMTHGRYDEGEAILQELTRLNNDPEYAIKIDKLLRDPKTKEGIEYAAKLNKKGIELYQKQNVEGALMSFIEVHRELPNHVGLNLNLMQALISKSKDRKLDNNEQKMLTSCFQRIGKIEEDGPHKKRYDYLEKRYKRLIQGNQTTE